MPQTALITGASGGLGKDFAHLFAKQGFNVVLVARTADALEVLATEIRDTYKVQADVLPFDLSKPGSADLLVTALVQKNIQITALINNAGFATYGEFSTIEWPEQESMIALNMTCLTHLTRLLLPPMIAAKKGYILNVSSMAAFMPGPLMATYYASKAYVLSLSVALRDELIDTGIFVTALCPGPTKTGFQNRAHMQESKLFSLGSMSSFPVAQAGVRGLLRNKAIVIPSAGNRFFSILERFLPFTFTAKIVHRMQEKQA